MKNFCWIGGCPSGGKTTLSVEISKATNISVYHIDDHLLEYGARLNAMAPEFHQNVNLNFVDSIVKMPDEPWFSMFISGLKAQCTIILDDVTELFGNDKTIIEGGVLLPEVIAEIGAEDRAVFVNPTYEYLREYLPKQGWVRYILSCLDDENGALFIKRLLYKYNLFREYIIDGAVKYKIKMLTTAASDSLDNNVKMAVQYFA